MVIEKLELFISLVSRSVGSEQATHAYKLHLKQLLDEYDLACLHLQTVETEIIAVHFDRAKCMLPVCHPKPA